MIDPKCAKCSYHGNCLYENSESCGIKASWCCECQCPACKNGGYNK